MVRYVYTFHGFFLTFSAERDMCSTIQMGRAGSSDLGGSYLSSEANVSLSTQISELEKPGFQYCMMYSEDVGHMVSNVR
jgi:hypothetical protein